MDCSKICVIVLLIVSCVENLPLNDETKIESFENSRDENSYSFKYVNYILGFNWFEGLKFINNQNISATY